MSEFTARSLPDANIAALDRRVNPAPIERDPCPARRLTPTPVGLLDPAGIPPRRWYLGRRFLGSNVTLTIAPGGVGKSTLAIAEAIAMVTGRNLTGMTVHEPGPVWLYNAEDPMDELDRRIAAACIGLDVPFDAIRHGLYRDSGLERPFIVAEEKDDQVVATPDVEAVIDHIRQLGIKLLVVDPFVRVHRVGESDNEAMDMVIQQFSRIAVETGCAINLVHHTRKPAAGASDGQAGNMDAGRGASSVAFGCRVAHTMFSLSPKDADHLGIHNAERHLFLRLDDAKANLSLASADARYFRRETAHLPNGDEVGYLRPVDMQTTQAIAEELACSRRDRLLETLIDVTDGAGAPSLNKAQALLKTAGFDDPNTTLRNRLEDAVPQFPDKATIEREGTTYRLWRQRSGAHPTAPFELCIKADQ